jgi:hypothetical protein
MDVSVALCRLPIEPAKEFLRYDPKTAADFNMSATVSVLFANPVSHEMELRVAQFDGTISISDLWKKPCPLHLNRLLDTNEVGRVRGDRIESK